MKIYSEKDNIEADSLNVDNSWFYGPATNCNDV